MLITPEEGKKVEEEYIRRLRAGAERDIAVEAVIRLSRFERFGLEPEEIAEALNYAEYVVNATDEGRAIILPKSVPIDLNRLLDFAFIGAKEILKHPTPGILADAEKFVEPIERQFWEEERQKTKKKSKRGKKNAGKQSVDGERKN